MKPLGIFVIGITFLIAIFLFETYPQWLAFLMALAGLTFVGWGIVVFPRFTTRFEMRLPEFVGVEGDNRQQMESEMRLQGAPLPYGEKRTLEFEVRTRSWRLVFLVLSPLLLTYLSAGNGGLRLMNDEETGRTMMVLYGALAFGTLIVVFAARWFNERVVLNNGMSQFVIGEGDVRSVRYDFRDAQGEYFGATHLRSDQSWQPGELDLLFYKGDSPGRSLTASSMFFHRIRRLDTEKR